MKKLYIIAALLMATTSAQAGGMTFQINGERVRVEAPRNCNAISCVKVTSPGYTGTLGNVDLKGMGSRSKDDDDVGQRPRRPHPLRPSLTAPQPPAPTAAARPRRSDIVAAPTPARDRSCPAHSARRPRRPRPSAPAPQPAGRAVAASPELADRRLVDGREEGQRQHRGMRRQSVRVSVDAGENPDQHEAAGQPRATTRLWCRQRSQLRLDDQLKSRHTLKVQGYAFGGMFSSSRPESA